MYRRENADIDVNDYFLLDEASQSVKYEYFDGEVVLLAGGSNSHSIIAANITSVLNYALRKRPCTVYSSDVRVKLSETRYVHPDVTVSCDKRDHQAQSNIQYPCVLFEVLSPSTELKDKGEKLLAYLQCSTLEHYVLVDSRSLFVEVYRKEQHRWTSLIIQAEDMVPLVQIGVEMTMEDIYAKTGLL
jgi:Uma2 family endonuclease